MAHELERGLRAIELMSQARRGLTFTEITSALDAGTGPTHRLMAELVRLGYARLDEFGRYHLTLKHVSHALQFLEHIPLVDLMRPLLEELATASGELARLNLVDGNHLVRISKAQGQQSGLKYDPLHGGNVPPVYAASGLLLLSSLSDDDLTSRLRAEVFATSAEYGSAAPKNIEETLILVQKARAAGYLFVADIYEDGIATLAYPIRATGENELVGVLTVSGPSFRFTEQAAHEVLPLMKKIADDLGRLPVGDMLAAT